MENQCRLLWRPHVWDAGRRNFTTLYHDGEQETSFTFFLNLLWPESDEDLQARHLDSVNMLDCRHRIKLD